MGRHAGKVTFISSAARGARSKGSDRPFFPLLGEPLALDLINTEVTVDGWPVDLLNDHRLWREWLSYQQHRIAPTLGGPITDQMRSVLVLPQVRGLRAAARAVIEASRRGRPAALDAVTIIDAMMGTETGLAAPARAGTIISDWRGDELALARSGAEALLAALACAVDDLATDPEAAIIRQCEAPGCNLLFLPRHARRRLCSSWTCPSRVWAAGCHERRGQGAEPRVY